MKELKKEKGKPLYIKLYELMSEEIYTGRFRAGTRLPARRIIAEQLCVSENTVDAAYKMLVDTGYAVSIPRRGYIVSFKGIVKGDKPWENNAPEQVVFSPNGVDISHINRGNYAKLLRDIAYNDGAGIFSYPEKGGEFELRNAIAKYLYAFQNIKCLPEQIIIGAGAEYLILSLAALFDSETAFITENPCDTHFYRTLEDNGRRVETLPQNIGSFDFEALHASEGDILLIEPGARFPRGQAMTEVEYERLLEWANERQDRYIIENGMDSEIRYTKRNTLYSADTGGRVIYLGSFARSFCPAVKTSYMVLPYELTERWKKAHTFYYALSSVTEQLALAEFLNKGYFTKHYKAMRKHYHEKAVFLKEQLETLPEGLIKCELSDGSTYITAQCIGKTAEELKAAGRHCGVKLLSMNSFNIYKKKNPLKDDALIIGFGDLSRERIKTGIRLLLNSNII